MDDLTVEKKAYNSKSKGYLTFDSELYKTKKLVREACVTSVWKGLLARCNVMTEGEVSKHKRTKRWESYSDVSICDEWLDFQNFAEFYYEDKYRDDGWHLDKDILVKGNRVYAPEFCCFVPPKINTLFTSITGQKKRKREDLPTGVSYFKGYNNAERYRVRVNSFVTGKPITVYAKDVNLAEQRYKELKKEQITLAANMWRDKIDPRVYSAMIHWEV